MTTRLHTLDNGVRVICDPMPGLKTLAAVVAVRGGARWEDEARAGWSHLLEHLVFKGAGEMGAREIVERIEAQGGAINAATGYERTSFQVRTLDGCLPTALQVLSDLVFRPTLAPVEIEREKDVVAQEIAEAYDTPDDHVFEMAQAAAFAGQPLGRPILGSTTSLGGADAAAIEAWRRVLYSPDRMVVSVAGAVDEAELLDLARRWFGGQASAPAEAPAPARFVGGPATEARRIEQANLVFQIPAPAATDPAQPALRLFAEILGGGMASRLFQEAREARGLAYAIDAYFETYEDAGLVGIYAGAAADKAEELARLAAREVRALCERGPDEAELARARAQVRAGIFMSEESPASRAERLAAQTLIHGAPVSPEDSAAKVAAVTAEDMRALGARLLSPGKAAAAVLGPRAAAPAAAAFAEALYGGR